MPTKHEHLKNEIADVLSTVTGLTVVSSMVRDQEPERPYVRSRSIGWKKDGLIAETTVFITVYIEHEGGVEGLEEERNRLDNLIEKAFDLHTITDYTDADFSCEEYIHEYSGASGVYDENGNRAAFTATINVKYVQTTIT